MLATGLVFYLFIREVPYYSDDLWYSWIQEQEGYPTQRIQTIRDVLLSQYNHSLTDNNRVLVNGLVQVVVSFCPKGIFNILNTGVFLLTIMLMVAASLPCEPRRMRELRLEPLVWLFVIIMLFLFLPCHYEALMWATGSISYLWTGCAMVLFFCLWQHLRSRRVAAGWYVPLFLVGLLCGWSHEGYAVAVAVGCVADWWLHRRRCSVAQYVLCAGFMVGLVFLLAAPCMWLRLTGRVGGYGLFLSPPYLIGLVLPAGLLVSLLWLYAKRRRQALRFVRRFAVMIVAVVLSLLVALVADNGEHRAYWCPSFFCIVPLTALFASLVPRLSGAKGYVTLVAGVLALAFTACIYKEHCRVESVRSELVSTFRRSPDGLVVMDLYSPPMYAVPYTLDVRREYLKEWSAWHMAAYYGKPMLNFIPVPLYRLLSHPDTFFTASHRVPGTASLYTTPEIDVYVWPVTGQPSDTLLYGYAPVSAGDNVPLLSRLRRLLMPGSYPDTEVLPSYSIVCNMSDSVSYRCVPKSIYRKVLRIDRYE